MRLLDEIAPPQLVTCDGDSGGLKALRRLWPDTPVQRCIVHVKRNIQRATGLHPTSPMGKALQRLSFELLAVDNLDEAAAWTAKLHQFGTVFSAQLKARTYVKDVRRTGSTACRRRSTWLMSSASLTSSWATKV
ncbi:transposase [Corynebacterium hesseae]|uniref:transposase n=1 Tax=Corynebacterium hesseae TaxID=2913502 RepID=UPI00373F12FF